MCACLPLHDHLVKRELVCIYTQNNAGRDHKKETEITITIFFIVHITKKNIELTFVVCVCICVCLLTTLLKKLSDKIRKGIKNEGTKTHF